MQEQKPVVDLNLKEMGDAIRTSGIADKIAGLLAMKIAEEIFDAIVETEEFRGFIRTTCEKVQKGITYQS